jgi:site-specific recombinase XerC
MTVSKIDIFLFSNNIQTKNSTYFINKIFISQAECVRDKAIISLLADSGMRLNELLGVKECHVDWVEQTVVIWGKGASSGRRRLPRGQPGC